MATTVAQAKAAIYSQLASAPTFHPSTADLFTDFTVESGDIYTVSSDSTSYSVPVYGMKLKWNGSSKVEVQNSGNVQRDPVEKMAQKKSRRGGRSYMNGNIVEDQIAGVRSSVTQLANSWSVVVEGTGQNQHIKPAVIQASINAATGSSKITLSADNIILDGDAVASSLVSHDITCGDITADGVTVYADLQVLDEESLVVNGHTMLVTNIEKDDNTNTLTIWYTDGSHINFSKGGSGSGTITYATGTAIDEHQPDYSGEIEVVGTNITNSPYTVGVGVAHSTFLPQGASSNVPCVNVLYGNTVIARQDVTVGVTTPTITYDPSTHRYTASAQGKVWSTAYGTAATATSGTEAWDVDADTEVGVTYDEDYSPSTKRYKKTSGSGSTAMCVMGLHITVRGSTKDVQYNAPVTYAYRDGYADGVASSHSPTIDYVGYSSSTPSGEEKDSIRRQYEAARQNHDNFIIRVNCNGVKKQYWCET